MAEFEIFKDNMAKKVTRNFEEGSVWSYAAIQNVRS